MACASPNRNFGDQVPLFQLILRIPTLLWSVQAGLGIPDAVGLFSPPDLPLCQFMEITYLSVIHGLVLLMNPSFKFNWTDGKRPDHIARRRHLILVVGVTVCLWVAMMGVSPPTYDPWLRNDFGMLMLCVSCDTSSHLSVSLEVESITNLSFGVAEDGQAQE